MCRLLPIVAIALLQALWISTSTEASPLAPAAALSAADTTAADAIACYGFGWRGWGYYPGWFRPACAGAYAQYVAPAPYYAEPLPVYPAPGRCWAPPTPDGRPGYWAAC